MGRRVPRCRVAAAARAPFVTQSNFDLKPFIPAMLDLVGRSSGKHFMIQLYSYSMGIVYRTDLLRDVKLVAAWKARHGTDLAAPATLADYVEMSKFMKAEAGVAGSAMQGQRGDPNSMEFLNYLFSSGGSCLDAAGKVALDSGEARKALALMATVGSEFVIGLAVALMLDRVVRFKSLYFASLTIPMATEPG